MKYTESAIVFLTLKRNKVYKAVNDIGYISEMKQQTPAVLEKWIAGLLKAEGKVITRPAAELILNKTGASMDLIRAELDKIISYCGDRNEVTEKDIEDIAATALEYLKEPLEDAKTFKVEAKRSDKKFPMKSPEICREMGGRILRRFHHLNTTSCVNIGHVHT